MMTASDYPPAADDILPRRGSATVSSSSLHNHHHHQHPQQPTRIKSFLRQNHRHARKILLPVLYLILSALYFYNLLFHDVGSGVHILRNAMDENITHYASAPIWNSPESAHHHREHPPEPRSLADVTIANAEVAWKRRVDYETYLRKRAEMREVRRKILEEAAIRLKLQKENNNGTSVVAVDDNVDDADGDNAHRAHATEEEEHADTNNATAEQQLLLLKLLPPRSNNSSETTEDYIKRLSSLSSRRIPKRGDYHSRRSHPSSTASDASSSSQSQDDMGLLPVLTMITMCTIFRVLVSLLVGHFSRDNLRSPFGDLTDNDNDETTTTEGDGTGTDDTTGNAARAYSRRRGTLTSFVANLSTTTREAARLRRRARAIRAHRQFQRFVDRLNAERTSNGEREISSDTLRHLMNGRDFNGNDYDNLSSFVEESGPAIGSIFSCIGATQAEIGRCPTRVLGGSDELLSPNRHRGGGDSSSSEVQTCSICLEQYQVGDNVRTIPCFHTFHVGCIDPWLGQRAECPICKHSAIG